MVIIWIELEEFSTVEGMVMHMWFVWGVQLLCVCHYREMSDDRDVREGVIGSGVALGIGLVRA